MFRSKVGLVQKHGVTRQAVIIACDRYEADRDSIVSGPGILIHQ